MLTVAQLIEQLQELNPLMHVVISRDEEGNGYRHASGADDNAWVLDMDMQDAEFDTYCQEDVNNGDVDIDEASQVVVLW
jgi:hypothetical protein